MPIDYEAEYNNRARVPEHPGLIAGWAQDAAAYRESRTFEAGIAYGEASGTAMISSRRTPPVLLPCLFTAATGRPSTAVFSAIWLPPECTRHRRGDHGI